MKRLEITKRDVLVRDLKWLTSAIRSQEAVHTQREREAAAKRYHLPKTFPQISRYKSLLV